MVSIFGEEKNTQTARVIDTPTKKHFRKVFAVLLLLCSLRGFSSSCLLQEFTTMSEMNSLDLTSRGMKTQEADEMDWQAAKAAFENLKTKTPRPVST